MFTINASLMRMVILSVGISADILDYFVKILWLTGMFPLWLGNSLWLAKVRNSLRNYHHYKKASVKEVFFVAVKSPREN